VSEHHWTITYGDICVIAETEEEAREQGMEALVQGEVNIDQIIDSGELCDED
jgi:hypothetical protein